MSDLPQADELPRAAEGYDPARVEEAFASFADRVRELEAVASELRGEIRALRAQRAPLRDDVPWPADPGLPSVAMASSPDWVAAVPPPLDRARALPRLALEAAFLLLVAVLAGLADLSTGWILVVMASAWALVAAAEWASAARRARWHLDEIPPPVAEAAGERTGPWDAPVVGVTVVEAAPDPESRTVVATPPPDVGETGEIEAEPEFEVEPEPEPEPAAEAEPGSQQRRRFWQRRRAAEPDAPDPGEA